MSLILVLDQATSSFKIGFHHLFHKLIKGDLALPTKDAFGLGRVSEEKSV